MTDPVTSLARTLQLALREARRRILLLAAIFSVVALGALAFGVLMPKRYEAHSIIRLEARNIISPLMEGRAVTTGVSDQASILSQVMFSRRILREVLQFGGWGGTEDPREEERMLTRLSRQIRIKSLRPELVRLSYEDGDPRRCFEIATKLAEIYMREGMGSKERESREAFEFIDKQVKEYGVKLADAHAKVLAHRGSRDQKEGPKAPHPPAQRQRQPSISQEEYAALRAEEGKLLAELARTRSNSPEARQVEQQHAERTMQLQAELDRLLTTFSEEYPAVKQLREQVKLQRQEVARAREEAAKAAAALDDTIKARIRLEQVQNRIAAATNVAPVAALPRVAPVQPNELEMRGIGQDSTLAELIRRYEATRDVYQDLLKRRENARVSMDLDTEHRGLALRVQEPAEIPRLALGMRLMHTTLIGLVLAALAPLGLVLALVRFDPRVRSVQQIEAAAGVPVLVSIPHAATPADRSRRRWHYVLAVVMGVCVLAVYATFFAVRLRS